MSSLFEQNQLQHEKSPYLQLHAQDPVHWAAWGEHPLAKAKSEQKLILLSIGYLSCHWCHVMAVESFRDLEFAKLVNTEFVPILVDREERPDLDQYFMQVCRSLLDGSGGWPLNVILTPDAVPVFACIYLPRNSKAGGPGFYDILQKYSQFWKSDCEKVKTKGQQILEKIKKEISRSQGDLLQKEVLHTAVSNLRNEYDSQFGGFGPEPKFIMPHRLLFLLNRYRRTGEADLLEMVKKTCDVMRRGGVYDQVGFGIHRYSTDIFWFEPHFEKMVYDQAGLIQVYTNLWELTGKLPYAQTTEELVAYLAREMINSHGCFVAAEDADSEGKDGQFFLWTSREIMEVLGDRAGEQFCQVFGITSKGNFRLGADGNGLNILARKESFAVLSKTLGTSEHILRQEIAFAVKKLFARRQQRQAPEKDSLVITAWNGLVISSLAKAGHSFDQKTWVAMAERASAFFSDQLTSNGKLSHSYLNGSGNINAFASDYVFLAKGYLDLYSANLQSKWLAESINLFNICLGLFWDEQEGGLLEKTSEPFSGTYAMKSLDERDLPSVNAIALELCCWFAFITGDQMWQDYADSLVQSLGRLVEPTPQQHPAFLISYSRYIEPLRKVVISGEKGAADTTALLNAARKTYAPETIVMFRPADINDDVLCELSPLLADMHSVNGRTAAYICDSNGCYAPLTEPAELQQELAKTPSLPRK